jgi:hypothetical protein
MRRKFLLLAGFGIVVSNLPTGAAIVSGNLAIVQIDTSNNASGVTGSFGYSQGSISYSGGNRGDFAIRFDGATPADDLRDGMMIVAISQNGRSNEGPAANASGSAVGAGLGYATPAIQLSGGGYASSINLGASAIINTPATATPPATAPVPVSAAGSEWNANHSVGYFKYTEFLGGWMTNADNNGPMSSLASGSPGLTLSSGATNTEGTHLFDSTSNGGTYSVNLSSFTAPGTGAAATSQNGILLVVGGRNEANHATSRANADGTFDVFTRDSVTGSLENDGAGFVYIPTGQPGVVAMGRVDGAGTVTAGSGDFVVEKGTTGQWLITTTGYDPTNSTLLISGSGGESSNTDNIVNFDYNFETGKWEIYSRDIPGAVSSNPSLQNLGLESAFSFALIGTAVPEPSTALLGAIATLALLRRRR